MKNVSITLLVILTIGLMIPNTFAENVPAWIKNTAGWWASDQISEVEFVNALEYLVTNKIIIVDNIQSCVNELSEIFGDSIAMVQTICDSHESKKYLELVPFVVESNFNSLGFRGDEFSQTKPLDTYRIFMVGGSTMFGAGVASDETTIPGILQKMFDSYDSAQKIEVINAGFSGGNSSTELNLIKQKLMMFSPDLIIIYDGWNDLRADSAVNKIKHNWQTMCELSMKNDFELIIALQPIAGFGNKRLTQQESVNSFTGEDHNGFQLISAKSTYDYMGRELLSLQNNCKIIDLRGTFDDVSGPIYWDQGHVSDTANLILAEKFYGLINEMIFDKKLSSDKFYKIISKYNSPVITSYLLSKININLDYTKIKKQDLVTQYKKDGDFFYLKNQLGGSEKILVGKDLSKTDLSKINLIGQNLSGANLSGQDGNLKDLRKIDFTGTILRGANLSFTDLSGQDLSGKDLRGINFHNANLENVDLTNIVISKVIQAFDKPECLHPNDVFLNQVYEERCIIEVLQNELVRTDFSNANLRGVTISLSTHNNFIHFVDFSGADLTGIEFSNLKFRASKFIGTNFSNSNMNSIPCTLCDFTDAKFIDSEFFQTIFHNVSFRNAEIIDGSFKQTIFIDHADFSNADLKGTSFDEITVVGNIVFNCKNNQICN
jgi:uncharacterized protein YjbI with pentapeptide repeats